jgi:hypothetical protein
MTQPDVVLARVEAVLTAAARACNADPAEVFAALVVALSMHAARMYAEAGPVKLVEVFQVIQARSAGAPS